MQPTEPARWGWVGFDVGQAQVFVDLLFDELNERTMKRHRRRVPC